MTAVPLSDGPHQFRLICDDCGFAKAWPEPRMGHREAWVKVWHFAVTEDWDGRAWPLGPHRCPDCVLRERRAAL